MAKRKKSGDNFLGQMMGTGVTNLVGVGLIDATATQVAALPAATPGRNLLQASVGFQSAAMLGPNLKLVNDSLGGGKKTKKKGFI